MARRSFSLMLAWRYLNPRRALLSAVALISVTGVMLGVMVLVVVMSVMSGLEREVKGRLLGFIPHIRLDYAPYGGFREPVADWRRTAEQIAGMEGVAEAGPFVQDSMLIDIAGYRSAGTFRAIDTSNPREVEGLEAMLDYDEHPDSSSDMGLDDRVIISSKVARSFRAGVGETIRLLTLRNFEQVEAAYEKTKQPPVRERFAEKLKSIRERAAASWRSTETGSELSTDDWNAIYTPLAEILDSDIREPEAEIVYQAVTILAAAEDDPEKEVQKMGPDAQAEFLKILAGLDTTDVKEMDADVLKGIEEFVLPKEATIIGVYQSSQMALTPDVFVPLHLGQDLAGLDDRVQGVAVRIDDPYQAALVAERMIQELPEGWYPVTWMEELADFSRLIEQQRRMMYIVLSLIVLISAFSMTAVMYTVTIQKRREIGVMKALGAATGQIVGVFFYKGLILGLAGSAVGVGLGLLVVRYREEVQNAVRFFGYDPFPASFIGLTGLPAHVSPREVLEIGLFGFALCAVAGLLPAWIAARSDAARSLRNL